MRELLAQCLGERGFETLCCDTGATLAQALAEPGLAVVVLDLQVADGDGLALSLRIRQACACPLIMVTPRGEPDERIAGPTLPANDYLAKPFEPQMLAALVGMWARSPSMVRRSDGPTYPMVAFDRWRLSRRGRHLTDEADTVVMLSKLEFRLLNALLEAPGKVLSVSQLHHAAGKATAPASPAHVDEALMQLHRKLGNGRTGNALIRRVGDNSYMIDIPATG